MTLFRFLLAGLLGATIIGGFESARAAQGDIIEIIVLEDGSVEVSCSACIAACVDVEGQFILAAEFNRIGRGCRITASDGLALQAAVEELLELVALEDPAATTTTQTTEDDFLELIVGGEPDAAQNTEDTSDTTPNGASAQ